VMEIESLFCGDGGRSIDNGQSQSGNIRPSQKVSGSAQTFTRVVHSSIRRLRRALQEVRFKGAGLGVGLTSNQRRLLRLKNRYVGRRAFVIGNGPSLRQTDVTKLAGEITIGSNGIFLLTEEKGFRPTFYTAEDRLVAEDRAAAICRFGGTTKIFPLDLSCWLRRDQDTIYVNFLRRYPNFPRFSSAFEKYVCWGGTVTFFNLQLAYYLGIREVYLVGVDHTYQPPAKVDEVNGTIVTSRSIDRNHFHPDYFGPGYRWHDPQVQRMEMAYSEAERFFKCHGGVIYNATIGGQLEVFHRVEFGRVVEGNVS
jgi:Protein of unknown function DUF115